MNVDLGINTLKYYKRLDVPVLLVRYSEHTDSIYTKWINNVDLFFAKKNAKTYRIKLSERDLWNSYSSEKIEKRLINLRKLKSGYFNFPIPFSIHINEEKVNGFSKSILMTQLRGDLQLFEDYLKYVDPNNSVIEVHLNNKELRVNICDVCGCSFHSINKRNKEGLAEDLSKDIVLGVAISMIQIGQIEYCGRLIFDNNLESRLLNREELLKFCLPPLFQSSFLERTLGLIDEVWDNTDSVEIKLITQVNLLIASGSKNKEKQKIIESFLLRRLDRAMQNDDDTRKGISHYNLGNFYRGKRMNHKAIHHYVSAKKLAPVYLKQHYFFSEIAGVLFLSEKYKSAAKFYSNAIELGAANHSKALYADALMFSGEYDKAKSVFQDYLEEAESPSEEFILKTICLEQLIKEKKIKKQIRKRDEANILADLTKLKNGNDPNDQLNKALELDMLSGLAWFNLGIVSSDKNEFSQATFCFTMAAIMQNNDIEAWKNATLCAFNTNDDLSIIPLIIRTAYFFNREKYLEALYFHLEQQNDSNTVKPIIEMVEKILPEKKQTKEDPTVRVLNENGIFENIFEMRPNCK